jgi:hypothetical protein
MFDWNTIRWRDWLTRVRSGEVVRPRSSVKATFARQSRYPASTNHMRCGGKVYQTPADAFENWHNSESDTSLDQVFKSLSGSQTRRGLVGIRTRH